MGNYADIKYSLRRHLELYINYRLVPIYRWLEVKRALNV